MLRMNIGGRGEGRGPVAQYVAADLEAVDFDPFAKAGPVQAKGGTGAGGADVSAPPAADLEPVDFNPFAVGGGAHPDFAPPPAQTRGPGQDTMLGALTGTNPATFVTGGAGLGQPDASAIPAPDAPRAEEQTYMGLRGEPGWFGRSTFDPISYSAPGPEVPSMPAQPDLRFDAPGASLGGNAPVSTPSMQLPRYQPSGPAAPVPGPYARLMAEPLGTGATPDRLPPQANRGDGTSVGMPAPGSVSYDPSRGDVFGGHASNRALALASLVPLTSAENLSKRISIYSQDLGIPPDRFFTDEGGNVKYVDQAGQTFAVAPTIEGGTIRAPLDLARRALTQGAAEFGQGVTMAAGGAAGLLSGPENYALGAMGAAALGSGVADVVRQIGGNVAAGQAGYRRSAELGPPPMDTPALDIDWLNVAGQAVQNAGFEGFARIAPAILGAMAPAGLFGNNPYRLTGSQAQDLARVLHDDARHGGTILKRAQVANELGLPLTPADLLTVTRGVGGSSADMTAMRARLYDSLSQLENSVANAPGKRGAGGRQWMQQYYTHRARDLFPQAVTRLAERISPVESPAMGFRMFRDAAGRVINTLEQRRLEAGHRAGWESLFSSPTIMANPIPAINMVDQRLRHAAGPIREELQRIRNELVDRATYTHQNRTIEGAEPVTDFQRLHQVRLHLERRIEDLRGPGARAEQTELANELDGIRDVLRAQLNDNPLYFTGDRAFTEASSTLGDAKRGILALARENPLHQERLGGNLADSGPTTIAAARKLFEEAGELDAWNAHTRAYLETNLRNAGGGSNMGGAKASGYQAGLDFANEVASQPKLHAGLMQMIATERERELLDGLIDAGFAIDMRGKGLADIAKDSQRADPRRLNPNGSNVFGRAAGVLTPIQTATRRLNEAQTFLNTRGAQNRAVELAMPAGTSYQNMAQTTIPLAGTAGEVLERGLYAAAPAVEGATDMIPRPSPTWAGGILAPYLNPPPQRDPTAPDLAPAAQRRMMGLLGPAPR